MVKPQEQNSLGRFHTDQYDEANARADKILPFSSWT